MGKILNAEEGKHLIQNYSFKKFHFEEERGSDEVEVKPSPKEESVNPKVVVEPQNLNLPQLEKIDSVVEKVDSLYSKMENLEKELLSKTGECEKRVTETKELSYKNGFNEGYNQAKREMEGEVTQHLSKLIESLNKLEEVYKVYQNKIENIEKELVGVAIDIAEEVIAKELSKHSKEIALSLTKELINDIKEATKIEVKVNPLDYDYVKDKINLDKITIKPDNAISPGGVVIISDVGNIEAEIAERFKVIKNNILKVR